MQKKRLLYVIGLSMKLMVSQIILSAIFSAAAFANDASGQGVLDKLVTINAQNTEIKTIIAELKRKTEVEFIYSTNTIQADRKISVTADEKKLGNVLNEILQPLNIGYKVVNEQILLFRLSESNTIIYEGQTIPEKKYSPITGIITSSQSGEPLAGATVIVKGKKRAVTTNNEGKFSIEADPGDVLIISSVGYADFEVTIGQETAYVVKLINKDSNLDQITVIGSRGKPRSDLNKPVPIDVVTSKELAATGQIDIGQALTFSAPSFNAQKFGINDLAPLVDPAMLRGLGPDQTLLLVNGKRRHKVAFFSLNQGVGKGQVGNDLNAIPAEAIKRVEILRDGAAAQYGSDAIAGVINMELNNARSGGSVRFYTGGANSNPEHDDQGANASLNGQSIYNKKKKDGETYKASLNFGLPWGKEGFINTTLVFHKNEAYSREGKYKATRGWYVSNSTQAGITADSIQIARNGINLNRAVLGGAKNTNYGVFVNAGNKIDDNWNFYSFGGFTNKEIIGGVFSRPPSLASRRVLKIFPDGYNPEVVSKLKDYMLVSGIKGKLGNEFNLDFSGGYSGNQVDFYARNTVNPSMDSLSPTHFYTGSLGITQTTFNADITKTLNNTSFAVGAEFRSESFEQKAGQAESYLAGARGRTGSDVGSSGREGFSPKTAGLFKRNNVGIYAEVDHDFSKAFLVSGAFRFENYSDFGSNSSYKIASRYKITDNIIIRGSYNKSFRAPSLVQLEYSNYSNIAFDNAGNSVLTPTLPVRNDLVQTAFGFDKLKPEISHDFGLGVTGKIGKDLSFTIDGYQVKISDRILLSQPITASLFPAFAGTNYQAVNVFLNAYSTKTKGLDFITNYKKAFNTKSGINLSVGLNLNKTDIETIELPQKLVAAGINYNTNPEAQQDIVYFTKGTPTEKIIFSANYEIGKSGVLLRATRFGKVYDPLATLFVVPTDPNALKYQVFSAKTVTDLSFTFKLNAKYSMMLGVNNLFDVYPDLLDTPQTSDEVIYSRRVNQFGTQGRFINFSMNYNF